MSETLVRQAKRTLVASILHCVLNSVWLSLPLSSRTDLRNVWTTQHAEQVQYMELQEDLPPTRNISVKVHLWI
jgi:hypothetical protein